MPLKTRTFGPGDGGPSTAPDFVFTGAAEAIDAVRRITTPDTDRREPKMHLIMGDILDAIGRR